VTVTVGAAADGTTAMRAGYEAARAAAPETRLTSRTVSSTSKRKVAWGQLWRAQDTIRVYRNGTVIRREYLGIRSRGYNAWVWRHSALRRGRYAVRVCGKGTGYRYCRTVKTFRRS
jgi:hypothetical protein